MQPNNSGNQSNNQLDPITFFDAPFLACPKWDPSCLHPFKGTPKKGDTRLINTHYITGVWLGLTYSGTPSFQGVFPHHFPYDPAWSWYPPPPSLPTLDRPIPRPVLGIQRDTLGIIQESTHRTLVMFLSDVLRTLSMWCHKRIGKPPFFGKCAAKKQNNSPIMSTFEIYIRLG